MITADQKLARRERNIYSVAGAYVPATPEQAWNDFQLQQLDTISTRNDFDYWVCCSMTADEYERRWRQGVRTVLWYDTKHQLHLTRIGQQKILHEAVTA
jgi:hypothetical protein